MQSFNNKLESSHLSSVHQPSPLCFLGSEGKTIISFVHLMPLQFWFLNSHCMIFCKWSNKALEASAARVRCLIAVANSIILQMTQAARLQPSICACPVRPHVTKYAL